MKRRGFLGLMGGAVVAGPSMAKEAARVAITSDFGGKIMPGAQLLSGAGLSDGGFEAKYDPIAAARESLTRLLGKSAARIAREKRNIRVTELDGDIANMRSLAWHAKIAMQRDRDFERAYQHQRAYIEEFVEGVLDEDEHRWF